MVLNMGADFSLPEDQWKDPAKRIEGIITGQHPLFACSQQVEHLECYNQIPFLSWNSFMSAPILMKHHPNQWYSLTAFSLSASLDPLGYHPFGLQRILDPRVTTPPSISFIPRIKVIYVPAPIASLISLHNCHDFIDRRSPRRSLG
jgi:hypothetical protein